MSKATLLVSAEAAAAGADGIVHLVNHGLDEARGRALVLALTPVSEGGEAVVGNHCDHRFLVELDRERREGTVASLITEVAVLRRCVRLMLAQIDADTGLLCDDPLVATVRKALADVVAQFEAMPPR